MSDISLGVVIVFITLFGSISNWLNWRYLNNSLVRTLYYVGAFVHETSHAILCIVTGATIEEFVVFSDQPRVVHRKSKIPFVGGLLISAAPIAGGLLVLFLINHYLLGNYFVPPTFSGANDWWSIVFAPIRIIAQFNLLQWQSWVMILLSFNVGAMIGPSPHDLRNVWPMLIMLFFVHSSWLANLCLVALSLIVVNIMLQLVAILIDDVF